MLAANARLAGFRPLAPRLTVFGSYVVLTEPVPELLEEIGWTGGEAIADARTFLHYFRTTNDGRVLMGSGSGPIAWRGRVDERFFSDAPTGARAERGLRRLLPGLAKAKVTHSWGGPIDVSSDHLPFFGTLPGRRVHFGAGYSGNGAGPSWVGGQVLASLVLRSDDEWAALPLANRLPPWLPPEPFRRVGGGLVRASIMAVEEAEEEGRPRAARRPGRRGDPEARRDGDRHALSSAHDDRRGEMSVTASSYQNFVGGEWVDSVEGETMEVLNPATGETIAEVPRGTAKDVDRAVAAAKKALPEWLETTPAERAELLLKLADALDEHAEELAQLESLNVGKPLSYARDEMPVSSDNIRFFAGAARVLEGRSAGEYMRGYTSMIRREPLGIVGGIAPWNYPLMMAVWKFSPALAAGNVQVLKPSEQTPLSPAPLRADRAGDPPAGRVQRRHRRRRAGRARRS